MTSEEYKNLIDSTRANYDYLNLTFEQAEQVYRFEEDKNTFSRKHSFTEWEEWEYEAFIFRELLDARQLRIYEDHLNQRVKQFEQILVEQDKEPGNKPAYFEDFVVYYEKEFLPDIYNDSFIMSAMLPSFHKTKIDFLRLEYKNYLNDSKKALLINHFRENRLFRPNELKAFMLSHKLSYLWPDYNAFKHYMDEPTKAVASFLLSKIYRIPKKTEQLIAKKMAALKSFGEENSKKHYGGIKGLRIIYGELTKGEEREQLAMTLLLLDKGKYGA